MREIAIVTGASRGIGLAISKMLLELNYTVFGICRNPDNCDFKDDFFHLFKGDLGDPKTIPSFLKSISDREKISLLIHNAGVAYFSPMEELSPDKIIEMVQLNLSAPMLLTQALTRTLKRNEGRIIFIGSVSGLETSPWGNVYGALKAGLHHFARLLYDELRKYSVKVHLLIPDITKTEFYNHLNIEPDEDPKSYLFPDQIAKIIKQMLLDDSGMVIPEVIVKPELFKIKRKKFLS